MNVMNHFTLRSMGKNRKWTVVTLIGIILSTAMLSAVSTFSASFWELMRNEAIADNGCWHAAVSVVQAGDVHVFEEADFVDEISLSRNIGYAQLPDSKNKYKPYLFIQKFDEKSYETFPVNLLEGRMPQKEGELVLPEHLQTNGGVKYEMGKRLHWKSESA